MFSHILCPQEEKKVSGKKKLITTDKWLIKGLRIPRLHLGIQISLQGNSLFV